MIFQGFEETMRRIVTGDDANGKSTIIIDGPPSGGIGDPALGGLAEIWHEAASGAINPKDTNDLGETVSILAPGAGKVKVRWFMIQPPPENVPPEMMNEAARARFADFGAAFGFMTHAAIVAEKMDHHPEWSNAYNRVLVRLSTHDAGGVTDRDIALAEAMDRIAGV